MVVASVGFFASNSGKSLTVRHCAFLSPAGKPCGANPRRESGLCLFHDPSMAKEAAEAQRLGGLRSRRELGVGGGVWFTGMRSLDDLHRVLDIATFDNHRIGATRSQLTCCGLRRAVLLPRALRHDRAEFVSCARSGTAAGAVVARR